MFASINPLCETSIARTAARSPESLDGYASVIDTLGHDRSYAVRRGRQHPCSWLKWDCSRCNERCPRLGAERIRRERKKIKKGHIRGIASFPFFVVVWFSVPRPRSYKAPAAAVLINNNRAAYTCLVASNTCSERQVEILRKILRGQNMK